MALPAGMLMRRFGYRAGILCGLGLYALGAVLFYPAAEIRVYGVFLAALFVIASGAAFLETAANPYIVAFGDPARASQRLNLAQSFNGRTEENTSELQSLMRIPYAVLCFKNKQ